MIAPSVLCARRVGWKAFLMRGAHSTPGVETISAVNGRSAGSNRIDSAGIAAKSSLEKSQSATLHVASSLASKSVPRPSGSTFNSDKNRKVHVAGSKDYRPKGGRTKGGFMDQIVGATRVADLLHVLTKLEAKNGHAERFHYVRAIERLEELKAYEDAMNVPFRMLAAGSPTKDLKMAAAVCLKVCKRTRRPDLAQQLLNRMEESTKDAESASSTSSLAPDVQHYTEGILSCAPVYDWQKALAMFRKLEASHSISSKPELPRQSLVNFSAPRSVRVSNNRSNNYLHSNQALLPQHEKARVDLFACSALLTVLAQTGQATEALKVVRRMTHHLGLTPDLHCFNGALAACAESKKHAEDAVELLLVDMPAAGVAPDSFSYASAIHACERSGSWRSALQLYDRLCDATDHISIAARQQPYHAPPPHRSAATWTTAAAAAAAGDEGSSRLRQMLEKHDRSNDSINSRRSSKSVSFGMNNYSGLNNAEAPLRVFRAVLAACAKGGQVEKALEVVAQLRSGLERDLVSALTIGPHPPSPSLRAPSPSPALGSNQARASYLAHTEKRAAQAAAAAASRQSKAQAIALQKLKADLLVCYNAAIKACGKAGALREALDLYEHVAVDHPVLAPDVITFSATIDACAKTGDWETALGLLAAMRFDYGVSPNVVTYTSAMQACAVRGKWKEALALLHEMTAAAEASPNQHHQAALAPPGELLLLCDDAPPASATPRVRPTEEFRRSTSRARRAAAAAAVKPNDRTFGAAFRAAAEAGTSAPVRELLAQWSAAHDYELQLGGPKERAQRLRDAAERPTGSAVTEAGNTSSAGNSDTPNVEKRTEATSRDSRSVAVYGGLGGSDAAFTWVYALRACVAANDWPTALHVLETYRVRRSLQRWGSRTGVAMVSSKKSSLGSGGNGNSPWNNNRSSEVALSRSAEVSQQEDYGPGQGMYRSMDELWCDECDAALLACANALRDDDDDEDGFIHASDGVAIGSINADGANDGETNRKRSRKSCAQDLAALADELQRHSNFAAWPQTAEAVDTALSHSRANPAFGGLEWRLRRISYSKVVHSTKPLEMSARSMVDTATVGSGGGDTLQDSTLMSEFERAIDRPNNFVK